MNEIERLVNGKNVFVILRVCSENCVNNSNDVTLVKNNAVVEVFPNVAAARQMAAKLIERAENEK